MEVWMDEQLRWCCLKVLLRGKEEWIDRERSFVDQNNTSHCCACDEGGEGVHVSKWNNECCWKRFRGGWMRQKTEEVGGWGDSRTLLGNST